MIGVNLPAMRARDILSSVDLLAARTDVDPTSIRAAASNVNVKGIWLCWLPLSIAESARFGLIGHTTASAQRWKHR